MGSMPHYVTLTMKVPLGPRVDMTSVAIRRFRGEGSGVDLLPAGSVVMYRRDT